MKSYLQCDKRSWNGFTGTVLNVSDLALLLGPLQDPLLDGTLTDEAIDSDLLGLTQPVSSVHGLLVHCGVPVAVIEDDLKGIKMIFTCL